MTKLRDPFWTHFDVNVPRRTDRIPYSRLFREKLIVAQKVEFSAFREPQISFRCPQYPATCPSRVSDWSNPRPRKTFISILILYFL